MRPTGASAEPRTARAISRARSVDDQTVAGSGSIDHAEAVIDRPLPTLRSFAGLARAAGSGGCRGPSGAGRTLGAGLSCGASRSLGAADPWALSVLWRRPFALSPPFGPWAPAGPAGLPDLGCEPSPRSHRTDRRADRSSPRAPMTSSPSRAMSSRVGTFIVSRYVRMLVRMDFWAASMVSSILPLASSYSGPLMASSSAALQARSLVSYSWRQTSNGSVAPPAASSFVILMSPSRPPVHLASGASRLGQRRRDRRIGRSYRGRR